MVIIKVLFEWSRITPRLIDSHLIVHSAGLAVIYLVCCRVTQMCKPKFEMPLQTTHGAPVELR